MARRLLKYPRTVSKHQPKNLAQTFKYLLVLDFEATCDNVVQVEPQEILEMPCLAVSTEDWQVKDRFHQYVKPRIHPNLTLFCTELTGIMQQTVDNERHFPEVFSEFCSWLKRGNYFDSLDKSIFVTCGNWDLNVMLPKQCQLENVTLPEEFKRWIDLKKIYCDATFYYPRSMVDMMMRLNLPMEGHLHAGIDDVANMTRIIEQLVIKYNPLFKVTHTSNKTTS